MRFALMLLVVMCGTVLGQVGDVLSVIETPGPRPTGLAFDGENLWLADSFTDKIYCIDPETGKVLRSFDSPGHKPEGLAWDGKHLWHVDSDEMFIYRLDVKDGSAVKIIETSTTNPRDIAWDGKFLWIVDHKKDIIMKASPFDGMAIDFFKAPVKETTGLTFDGKYLWAADRLEDRIYLINPEDGLCISSMRSHGPFPYGLTWADDELWCADFENQQIYKIKVFDDDALVLWDKREIKLNFIKEFRNYGPGKVDTLDIYLALPMQRDNQKLYGEVIFDSPPTEIITDEWGQRIARFSYKDLEGYSVVRPGWKVDADIYATEWFIYPDRVGMVDEVPANIKDKYLADNEKYLIHDPYIKKLAEKIAGDEKNPYWVARKVLEYLTKSLSYKLKPMGGWNAAPMVLKRGTASCSEYSYCMIALCRNRGVPIRYVGAASTRGDDGSEDRVFHRWVEVYLPNYGWVPFDANVADAKDQGKKVLGVGNVKSHYIMTTQNGGGDEFLGYGYNFGYKWTGTGKCRVYEETYGLWSKRGEKNYNKPNKEMIAVDRNLPPRSCTVNESFSD